MLELIAAAGLAIGPIRIDERYRDVIAALDQAPFPTECYGRDDVNSCSRSLEYSSMGRLVAVTFYAVDGIEESADILMNVGTDVLLRNGRKLAIPVAWNWQGVDIISGALPIFVKGWVRKRPGIFFVKADSSGIAVVFERWGKLRRFRLGEVVIPSRRRRSRDYRPPDTSRIAPVT